VAIRISQAFLQKIGLAYFEEMPTKCMRRFQILTHETVQDRSSFEYTKKYDNFDALIAHELIALDTIKKYHAPNTS
jgi:hypothetical protein